MKRILLISFVVGWVAGFAQQLPQYSQYMLNQMAINPAVAGIEEFAEVRSNSRHQWLGINDAPRTYMLTAHGPIADKHMGLGMNLYTDVVGPTRRTGLSFAYSYQLQVDKRNFLAMGLSAGIQQWGIDGHKITLREEGDLQLLTNYQTVIVPEFGAGIYFYDKSTYYVGLSMPQFHQSPLRLYPGTYKNSRLASQLNLNGGYRIKIDEQFDLEPSMLVKYSWPAPPKIDIGLRAIYKDMICLGGVYRHNDAVSVLAGYLFDNYLLVGYSYDITITPLKNYSGGTHELMLGLRFARKQARVWDK